MAIIEVETIRIGEAIGLIIPKEVAAKEGIKANESIKIEIKKRPTVAEVFGMLGDKKLPTEEIIAENKKLNLSYVDVVGYILSKRLGVGFLTGDEGFKHLDNVIFIKKD